MYTSDFQKMRQSNFFKQLYYLVKRFLIYIKRAPKPMLALYSMSLFQCWIMCVVFHGVGGKRIWDFEDVKKVAAWKRKELFREYLDHNLEVAKDYNGFVFVQATDMFISIVFAQVLQMPKLHQIYVREMQNKMYSPSSFFLAKWFVTTLAYCL